MRSNYLSMALVLCGLIVTGCASAPPMERITYEEYWKDGKAPDTNTLLTCTEYASIASSYAREKRTPPPIQNVVNVNVTTPREYEGEISNCSYSTCELTLRETRSSRISSSIRETSQQMAQNYYEMGAAIGNAIAEGAERRRAESAFKQALDECYQLAGLEKAQRAVVYIDLNKQTCAESAPTKATSELHESITLVNQTKTPLNLVYLGASGGKKNLAKLTPNSSQDFGFLPGSSLILENAYSKTCVAGLVIPDYEDKTTLRLIN
jgi:hypothetical protein